MPGIAGIVSPQTTAAHQVLVQHMVATMQHRPDDVRGIVIASECGVCAGWVAHAGSFAARQSSLDRPDAARLLWSGECFGADGSGTLPTDPADNGSPLARYEAAGESSIASLNGLFSGLLIDVRRRRALLFNDRFGSERLYVHEEGDTVYFASEAKALLKVLPELRAFDESGVADFLAFGSTLEGRTLFRGLRMLPGGSLWRFEPGSAPKCTRYFTPQQWEDQEPLDDEGFEKEFATAFHRILPSYVASDRELGISLTGGLDTRMIMACLPRAALKPVCYTYAALRGETLDVRIGRDVAAMCGLPHQALRIMPGFVSDYGRHLDRTVYVTDGGAGALGAHELSLSEQAHRLAPVRLTGNFGSEVLRSMSTFKPIGLAASSIDSSWAAALAQATARVAQRQVHPVTHAAFEEIPWHLSGTLQASRSQLTVRTPYLDNEIVALAYRAPARLRNSTHPSMRLIHDNAPALARLPTDRGLAWGTPSWRSLPRRLFCAATFKLDYWHKEGLPSALSPVEPLLDALGTVGLMGLHKFLPYRRWFRRELAPYVAEVVHDVRTRHMPFWNPKFLETVADDHVRGRHNRLRELHAILTLEAVERLLIRDALPAGAAGNLA